VLLFHFLLLSLLGGNFSFLSSLLLGEFFGSSLFLSLLFSSLFSGLLLSSFFFFL